jgi:hypothetical protein
MGQNPLGMHGWRVARPRVVFTLMNCANTSVRPGLRGWLASATLVALLLRALIPVGFMPVASGSSGHLMFCHGMDGGGPAHPGSHGAADSHCAFALGAGAAPAPGFAHAPIVRTLDAWVGTTAVTSATQPPPARHSAPRGPPSGVFHA